MRPTVFFAGMCACALLFSCESEPPVDLTGPRFVQVVPSVFVLPQKPRLILHASEPLLATDIDSKHVLVVPTQAVDDKFLQDFENLTLSTQRQKRLVKSLVTFVPPNMIEVEPEGVLDAGGDYAVVVSFDIRDLANNPLAGSGGLRDHFQYRFKVEPGSPKIVEHDLFSEQKPLLAPNRRNIHIKFSQPMRGIDGSSVMIRPTDPSQTIAKIERVELNAARTQLRIELGEPEIGCERLVASASYEILFSSDVVGETELALADATIPFETGPLCDTSRQLMLKIPEVVASETSAKIQVQTTKASNMLMWYGRNRRRMDCQGLSCPVAMKGHGLPSRSLNEIQFLHQVQLRDLSLGQEYAYFLLAEDEFGARVYGEGTFKTVPLPKISINELMFNPAIAKGHHEWEGEYIELANFSDMEIDLSGYEIEIRSPGARSAKSCPLGPEYVAPVIKPGELFLIVGQQFEDSYYRDIDISRVHRLKSKLLCGRLSNMRPLIVTLKDPLGREVSSYGGHLISRRDGSSIERISTQSRDHINSFCFSRRDLGPTPTKPNGVMVFGCERY